MGISSNLIEYDWQSQFKYVCFSWYDMNLGVIDEPFWSVTNN